MKKKNVGEWLRDNMIWIALIPVIVTMVMIFGFSSQTSQVSSQTSGGITEAIIKIFVKDYDTLPEARRKEIENTVTKVVRKTAHIIEYTALGFFAMLYTEIVNLKKRIKPKLLKYLIAFVFSVAYACTDELHQTYVSGRGGRVTDVVIDGLGALIGILLLQIVVTTLIGKRLKKLNSFVPAKQ